MIAGLSPYKTLLCTLWPLLQGPSFTFISRVDLALPFFRVELA